jgi:hypothetical protein
MNQFRSFYSDAHSASHSVPGDNDEPYARPNTSDRSANFLFNLGAPYKQIETDQIVEQFCFRVEFIDKTRQPEGSRLTQVNQGVELGLQRPLQEYQPWISDGDASTLT